MHRDIKGPNVMLTNSAEIRLIDFGKYSCRAQKLILVTVRQADSLTVSQLVGRSVSLAGRQSIGQSVRQ